MKVKVSAVLDSYNSYFTYRITEESARQEVENEVDEYLAQEGHFW